MFLVARRLVWEWGNNSLKREGEKERERERGLVFAQCQTRGERQKFMGVVRTRGTAVRGKVENGVNRRSEGEVVSVTHG